MKLFLLISTITIGLVSYYYYGKVDKSYLINLQRKNTQEVCENLFKQQNSYPQLEQTKILYLPINQLIPTQAHISFEQIKQKKLKLLNKLPDQVKSKTTFIASLQSHMCKDLLKSTQDDYDIPLVSSIKGHKSFHFLTDGHHKSMILFQIIQEVTRLEFAHNSFQIPVYQQQIIKKEFSTLNNARSFLSKYGHGTGHIPYFYLYSELNPTQLPRLELNSYFTQVNAPHLIKLYYQKIPDNLLTKLIPINLNGYTKKHDSFRRFFFGKYFSAIKKFSKKKKLSWSSNLFIDYAQFYLDDYFRFLKKEHKDKFVEIPQIPQEHAEFENLSKKEKKKLYKEITLFLLQKNQSSFLNYISRKNYQNALNVLRQFSLRKA